MTLLCFGKPEKLAGTLLSKFGSILFILLYNIISFHNKWITFLKKRG